MITWTLNFLHSLWAFMLILLPLVVFHEFGHYVFARIFRVRAEIFSVGFGPKLWSRQWGETEFRLSAIPMGGYVKLLGEDRDQELPEAEKKRALYRQRPWKRFFIFLGGPLFNFLLAIVLFMAVLIVGEPQLAPIIGRVVENSVAQKIGFQSGDRVVSIDGNPIQKFEEISALLHEHPEKTFRFEVIHPQTTHSEFLSVTVPSQKGLTVYGEPAVVGELDGLMPLARSTQIGISNPRSILAQNFGATGDHVTRWNETPVKSWEELESLYSNTPVHTEVRLEFRKPSGELKSVGLKKTDSTATLADSWGLHSSELFVERVMPKSPAEAAGLQKGDRLMHVGSSTVQSFFELKDRVQESGEKSGKVLLQWERQGQLYSVEMVPTATVTRDPALNPVTQYTVGIVSLLEWADPITIVERVWNPWQLLKTSVQRMILFSERNFVSLKKMAFGDLSVGNLGGPLMIGKVAGDSLSRGWHAFLNNMAVFSIGLGVLNILPIPVLDGGHLLLLGVEIIRRKPLTLRQLEWVQGLGLLFIVLLMGIAFHNDIARLMGS